MKNKKFVLGLLGLSLLPLNACGSQLKLPETFEEVKAFVQATTFNKYNVASFTQTGKKAYKGEVYLGEQEIVFKGKSDSDDMVSYLGYETGKEDMNLYFNVNTEKKNEYGEPTSVKRMKIVEEVANKNLEITLAEAKASVDEAMFSKSFLASRVNPFLEGENVSFEVKQVEDNKEFYVVNLSYVAETTVYSAVLQLSYKDNLLLDVNYDAVNWGVENFDTATGLPLDATQTPEFAEHLQVNGFENEQDRVVTNGLFFEERNNYFVQTITEVKVYGEDAYNGDDLPGTASAGRYLAFEITGYEPATALNLEEFKFVSSSDESVISVSMFNSAKAVAKGVATVTISDDLGICSASQDVQVLAPKATSVSFKYGTKYDVALDESVTINYNVYPEGSEDEIEVTSSDETVLSVSALDTAARTFVVSGLKEGTADVTISVKGTTISAKKTFTVKKVDKDSAWLVGKWLIQQSMTDASFEFKADGTGKIWIDDEDMGVVRANFNWAFDGAKITLTNVKAEKSDITVSVTSISFNEARDTLKISVTYEDDWDTMRLTSKSYQQE